MGTCKTCSKKKHSCVSCGIENWEHDFCNETCLNQHLEKYYNPFFQFLNTLTTEQRRVLYEYALVNGSSLEDNEDAEVLSFRDLIITSITKVNSI